MQRPWFSRPFEFWPNWTHVIPFHIFLWIQCWDRLMPLKYVLKANYGINAGGMSFTSKYKIQEAIGHEHFPSTEFIPPSLSDLQKKHLLKTFANDHGFPIIIKPDEGMTGRGMMQIKSPSDIDRSLHLTKNRPYLAQTYIEGDYEFGTFWHRYKGKSWISGINQKHYPTVTGDGISDISTLARAHERYTTQWESFLSELDLTIVPTNQEIVYLSRIGSHTMGCKFTDETELNTNALELSMNNIFDQFAGYNYGRLDIKATSLENLQKGIFEVIEVNGFESQATHMFDPRYRYFSALRFLWYYARTLAQISYEHRKQKIPKISYWTLFKESHRNIKEMEEQQAKAETLQPPINMTAQNNKITCIVSAYNEAERIGPVLEVLVQSQIIDELLVIDDQSIDNTVSVIQQFPSVHLIENRKNIKKTASVLKAAKKASHDLIMLIDADLSGLTLQNLKTLARPVTNGEADMTISIRKNSLLLFKILGIDFVSGERVFHKKFLEPLYQKKDLAGFGLESLLNKEVLAQKGTIKNVKMYNVSHARKMEKTNWFKGTLQDIGMALQIIKTLGIWGIFKQVRSLKKSEIKHTNTSCSHL